MVAAALLGLGFGVYLAVDQALVTQVLPAAADRAKDLGIINIANVGPRCWAPRWPRRWSRWAATRCCSPAPPRWRRWPRSWSGGSRASLRIIPSAAPPASRGPQPPWAARHAGQETSSQNSEGDPKAG